MNIRINLVIIWIVFNYNLIKTEFYVEMKKLYSYKSSP